jgi:Putative zinc-finger
MLCERYREWMIPAALGGLPSQRGRELQAHVAECAPCRAEFERVKALTGAVDRGVAASANAQPSPDLAARVRARIAESPEASSFWPFAWWMPLAAGALAAAAVLALWLRPGVPATPRQRASPVTAISVPAEPSRTRPSRAVVTRMPHLNSRITPESVARLQVLVQPGEWNAVVRFAAAVKQGRVDGRPLVAAAEKSRAELGVKELQIAPLEIARLSGEQNSAEESNPH